MPSYQDIRQVLIYLARSEYLSTSIYTSPPGWNAGPFQGWPPAFVGFEDTLEDYISLLNDEHQIPRIVFFYQCQSLFDFHRGSRVGTCVAPFPIIHRQSSENVTP